VPLWARSATVDCSPIASKAILAVRAASVFRLDPFMIRSVYHDGTTSALSTPLLPNPGSTSVVPLSAINDKSAASGAKPRPIKFDHHVCRIRCLGLHAKQVT
jgi:hypothetical protein